MSGFSSTSFNRRPPQDHKDRLNILYHDGFSYVENAKHEEMKSNWLGASFFYDEAIRTFTQILKLESNQKSIQLIRDKITSFTERQKVNKMVAQGMLQDDQFDEDEKQQSENDDGLLAQKNIKDLENTHKPKDENNGYLSPPSGKDKDKIVDQKKQDLSLSLEQADFNFSQGGSHYQGAPKFAISMYQQAASMYLDILEKSEDKKKIMDIRGGYRTDDDIKKRVSDILKNISNLREIVRTMVAEDESAEKGTYTPEEKTILRKTSYVNGKMYLPWIKRDEQEEFNTRGLFNDNSGLLALSKLQVKNFGSWKRPHEFTKNPTMIYLISPYSIKQTIITDCSFVSSLTVAAYYERRFKKQLITNIIFPQDEKGSPIYNPSGKYMIRLIVNGVARKVLIDDRLPTDKHGRLMCSFSCNRGELWVSLVEKAFLKVMGGYQFPGSNSGIDLHILTGWIPERITIAESDLKDEKTKQRIWERMVGGQRYGDCLITVATGSFSKEKYEEMGLVQRHAYAVLRVEEVGDHKLLQLKNPWASMSWKGKFSPEDTLNWTTELKKTLDYDQLLASQVDNGIFWIDYDSLCKWYHTLYLNWNIDLFQSHCQIHGQWPINQGPKNDTYNFQYNPQYIVKATVPKESQGETVWFLLSRHVMEKEKEDEEDDNGGELSLDVQEGKIQPKEPYIALYIFQLPERKDSDLEIKSDRKTPGRYIAHSGQRIMDTGKLPPALHSAKYINNPHYLARVDAKPGVSTYNVIVSQYEKIVDIYYTLNIYSTASCTLQTIKLQRKYHCKVLGEWRKGLAGGSTNVRSHAENPQFLFQLTHPSDILIKLEAPKVFYVNLSVYNWTPPTGAGELPFMQATYGVPSLLSSGDYRDGFCALESISLQAGSYIIVASTYEKDQVGPFFLTLESNSTPVSCTPILK